MRKRCFYAGMISVLLSLFLSTSVWASTWYGPDGNPVKIEYWAGTGSNEALLVIEFGEEENTPEYAFGFRFDGTATGWDMISAVDEAGSLEVDATYYSGMGYFINNFYYDGHSGNASTWWEYSVAESDPDFHFPGSGWEGSSVGCSSRTLENGSWDGWRNPYGSGGPEIPTVPIPAAVWLLGSGLLGLIGISRKRL